MNRLHRNWLLALLLTVLAVLSAGNALHWNTALLSPRAESLLALRALVSCNDADVPCNSGALRRITMQRDPATALDVLGLMATQDAQIRSVSHNYAHEIGYATYDRYPTLPTRLSACRDTISSGCYHGVMMKDIGSNGMPSHDRVRHVCDILKTNTAGLYFQCLHGVGHGVMMAQLMMASQPGLKEIQSALASCDATRGEFERYHCARGTFMEYLVASTNPIFHYAAKPSYKANDPQWPCDQVTASHLAACYDYQGDVLLRHAGNDYRAAFQLCAQAPEAGQEHCAAGLGRNLNARADLREARTITQTCAQAVDDTQNSQCLGGAAQYFLNYTHSTRDALALCMAGAAPLQATCVAMVNRDAPLYGLTTRPTN